MKFYKRYPGDITIKTGDLTLVEFGAYDRLLDHYYAKEQPIDPKRVYTVARCQSAADRAAVDMVLAEYWTLTPTGWVQERADEMIADALPRIEAAKANGKKGGRPKKKPEGTQEKPTGFSNGTQGEPGAKTTQIPESLSPLEKKTARRRAEPPDLVGAEALIAAGFDVQTAAEFIAHKTAKKAPLTHRAWADHLRESEKAGWTPMAAAEKVMAKNWAGFEAKYVAHEARQGAGAQSFRERDHDLAAQRVAEMTGGLVSAKPRNGANHGAVTTVDREAVFAPGAALRLPVDEPVGGP